MSLRLQLVVLLRKCGKDNLRAVSRFTGHSFDMTLVKKNMAVATKNTSPLRKPACSASAKADSPCDIFSRY